MVWDEGTLDRFLENPTKFLPGTRMGYAGIKNAQERADLIAFLKQAGHGS
jgi:cytochrome c